MQYLFWFYFCIVQFGVKFNYSLSKADAVTYKLDTKFKKKESKLFKYG